MKQGKLSSQPGVDERAVILREAHLDFLGRNLVRLAHDFKNHLATINQSAGLMADLLRLKHKKRSCWIRRVFRRGRKRLPDIDRFLMELDAIQEQVVQGSTLIQDLGRFGHRLEENSSIFLGNESLKEMRETLL